MSRRQSLSVPGHEDLSADAAHVIEQEGHVELLPGTEVMKDLAGVHFVHGNDSSHMVLVPQPSADIHDPLVRLSFPIEARIESH